MLDLLVEVFPRCFSLSGFFKRVRAGSQMPVAALTTLVGSHRHFSFLGDGSYQTHLPHGFPVASVGRFICTVIVHVNPALVGV